MDSLFAPGFAFAMLDLFGSSLFGDSDDRIEYDEPRSDALEVVVDHDYFENVSRSINSSLLIDNEELELEKFSGTLDLDESCDETGDVKIEDGLYAVACVALMSVGFVAGFAVVTASNSVVVGLREKIKREFTRNMSTLWHSVLLDNPQAISDFYHHGVSADMLDTTLVWSLLPTDQMKIATGLDTEQLLNQCYQPDEFGDLITGGGYCWLQVFDMNKWVELADSGRPAQFIFPLLSLLYRNRNALRMVCFQHGHVRRSYDFDPALRSYTRWQIIKAAPRIFWAVIGKGDYIFGNTRNPVAIGCLRHCNFGAFRNRHNYEGYVQLVVTGRINEAVCYCARVGHEFSEFDLFPYGYCYLNVVPKQFRHDIFSHRILYMNAFVYSKMRQYCLKPKVSFCYRDGLMHFYSQLGAQAIDTAYLMKYCGYDDDGYVQTSHHFSRSCIRCYEYGYACYECDYW